MGDPLELGAFHDMDKQVVSASTQRSPETGAGADANVVKQTTGEYPLAPTLLTACIG